MSPPCATGRPRNVTGTTLLFRLRGLRGDRVDPAVIGTRIASEPGADLVDKPVRLSSLVSFRGEKRRLGGKELRGLVRERVERAARGPREAPLDEGEPEAVAWALLRTLHSLGDPDLDDLEAVRLGHEAPADKRYAQAGGDRLRPERALRRGTRPCPARRAPSPQPREHLECPHPQCRRAARHRLPHHSSTSDRSASSDAHL